MIFSKDMDNLKIYKRPMFLPTLENDPVKPNKKTKSLIYLLTPSRNSSISHIKNPMTINRTRFQSYYIEKDLTYFINDKVLKSDNLDESAYIGGVEDNSSNLIISGFDKDVEFIKKFFTPELYDSLVKDLDCYTEIPTMNIIVGSFPERDGFFCMRFQEVDGKQYIYVDVPRSEKSFSCMNNFEADEYSRRVINFVIKALVVNRYPETVTTAIPAIVADTLSGAETRESNWGRFIFYQETDDNEDQEVVIQPNLSTFWKLVEEKRYKEILDIIRLKYQATMDELVYYYPRDLVQQEASNITMENLGNKFKYASTTKFKKKFSEKSNAIKRLLDRIGDEYNIQINIPAVGSPMIHTESVYNPLEGLTEGVDYIPLAENVVLFLTEDSKYDLQLKRVLYKDRIRKASQIQQMNKQIKADASDIKFAFTDIKRYNQKNLFVDLYFYNQVFFKNNTWYQKKGFDLYLDLLSRLINDPRFTTAGYEKKTVFIPIHDWNSGDTSRMWLYREGINPISIIYELMIHNPQKVKQIFKDIDIIFFGKTSIFKMNFDQFKDNADIKKQANRFRTFIIKITTNEKFDPEDVDVDTNMSNSPEAVKADLYDKFEGARGIDLTGKELKDNDPKVKTAVEKINKKYPEAKVSTNDVKKMITTPTGISSDIIKDPKEEVKEPEENKSIGQDPQKAEEMDADLAAIATRMSTYADKMDTDAAIDSM